MCARRTTRGTLPSPGPQQPTTTTTKKRHDKTMASEPPPYDRWSLLDPTTINYGYYSSHHSSPKESKQDTINSKKGFYITTAINYTNGPAHMGHAYEGVTTDAIARYARMVSGDGNGGAYFVTGADEHGEKIAKTAEREGKAPIEICDTVSLMVI